MLYETYIPKVSTSQGNVVLRHVLNYCQENQVHIKHITGCEVGGSLNACNVKGSRHAGQMNAYRVTPRRACKRNMGAYYILITSNLLSNINP